MEALYALKDWHSWVSLIGYLCVTGLLNFLFTRKSQITAWAEAHPERAAIAKTLRGIGFDPGLLRQAIELWFKKRLPPALQGPAEPEPPAPKPKPYPTPIIREDGLPPPHPPHEPPD